MDADVDLKRNVMYWAKLGDWTLLRLMQSLAKLDLASVLQREQVLMTTDASTGLGKPHRCP